MIESHCAPQECQENQDPQKTVPTPTPIPVRVSIRSRITTLPTALETQKGAQPTRYPNQPEGAEGEDTDCVQLEVDGALLLFHDRVLLHYREDPETGMDRTLTFLSWSQTEGPYLELVRTGSVGMELSIDPRIPDQQVSYNAVYFTVEANFHTLYLENNTREGIGSLAFGYTITFPGAMTERIEMEMTIRPAEHAAFNDMLSQDEKSPALLYAMQWVKKNSACYAAPIPSSDQGKGEKDGQPQ